MLLPFKSGIKNGTTTSGYVEAIRVDIRGCGQQGKMVIQIHNLSSTATMYYKIDGYLADADGTLGGVAIALKAETSIGTSTTVTSTDVDHVYAAVVVSVKQNSGAGLYQIQFSTY